MINLQRHFHIRARLTNLRSIIPNPPLLFGLQTSIHQTKRIFLALLDPPHKKRHQFFHNLSQNTIWHFQKEKKTKSGYSYGPSLKELSSHPN